jgi:hypothetical protein
MQEKQSYRESFGLSLPPSGTKVSMDWMAGMDFNIIWDDCPDGENVLYGWIKKRSDALIIIKKHEWILTTTKIVKQ